MICPMDSVGAALQGFHAELDLRICHGLTKDDAETKVIIAAEKFRGGAATAVAEDAAAIDIKTAVVRGEHLVLNSARRAVGVVHNLLSLLRKRPNFTMHHSARTPSRQPTFLPSA